MEQIVERNDPVLRKIAAEVPLADIQSLKIKEILRRMKVALDSQDDGVAIAAPQIGESLRIFIVSGRAVSMSKNKDEISPDIICINPKILKLSKKTDWVEEGCLSVRYQYGRVKRSVKASIRAFDQHGKAFELGGSGLLAQIFQHENDHLDGILFIDKAEDLEELPPEKA